MATRGWHGCIRNWWRKWEPTYKQQVGEKLPFTIIPKRHVCTMEDRIIHEQKSCRKARHYIPVMVRPPFPFSGHLWPPPTPSASAPPLLPPLHSNSKAYLHNLCSCIAPTLRLTVDQYWTHSDLVPKPRATIYIPFLHLSYLPDPFSLTIMGNYSFLV